MFIAYIFRAYSPGILVWLDSAKVLRQMLKFMKIDMRVTP